MSFIKTLLFIFIAGLAQCQTNSKTAMNEKLNPTFSYQVNQPTKVYTLPSVLQEVSALSLAEDGNLLTLNDEVGKVFKLNKTTGAVMGEYPFWAAGGDFEGIEMIGNMVYASTSKGKIYAISNYSDSAKLQVQKYETPLLNKAADVEGLGYDAVKNRLILGCKGARNAVLEREIWAFNLSTNTYDTVPLLAISYQQIQAWLDTHQADKEVFKDYTASSPETFHFGISGLAAHPKTGDFYLLSSPGKLLVVVSPQGEIKYILKLDKKIHPQPEGLTFSADGTMYITNEGKKENQPTLSVFMQR